MKEKTLELLAPAGNAERMETAVYFGADSVYLAGREFGLRAQPENFDGDGMRSAASFLHSAGKKMYAAVNIFARNSDFGAIHEYLSFLEEIKADAVIVSDPGVLELVLKRHTSIDAHISTQANTLNKYAARFYAELGAKRIVLARELSLSEIREIRDYLPDNVTLEAFAHGAMCVSYSGRCLLSNYLASRDANRGECVQACRWEYAIAEKQKEREYTVTEKARPNERFEIAEDARGTYILNSRDLCMLPYIDKLYDAGVGALKIEGRAKTAYYVAGAVNAYRRAIDALRPGEPFVLPAEISGEPEKISNRRYTTGFYFRGTDWAEKPGESMELSSSAPRQSYEFSAAVLSYDKTKKCAYVEMRNRFKCTDTLEVLSPGVAFLKTFTPARMERADGTPLTDANLVQERFFIYTDIPLEKGDILRKRK